jgi:RNA-directed DNA polymerase
MGLFSWLFQWFGGSGSRSDGNPSDSNGVSVSRSPEEFREQHNSIPAHSRPHDSVATQPPLNSHRHSNSGDQDQSTLEKARRPWSAPRLRPSRLDEVQARRRKRRTEFLEVAGASPYRFARFGSRTGQYLDFSQDGDDARLRQRGLPVFHTPEQLAEWLGLPLNKVAWLIHRFSSGKPASPQLAHYHYMWRKKKSGGVRLIESPKQLLKQVQIRILREILDHVSAHPSAHGFIANRSIRTNAIPHVGQEIVVKFDLSNFYATVGFSRVVAIFRSLGYSRESAIWLGMLTTSALPGNMPFDRSTLYSMLPYLRRHLPQGAPTSPALANLSAYRLDARLTGLARSFHAQFTRYADDLTISGTKDLGPGLRTLIPLVEQIIRRERFRSQVQKRQVLRSHQRLAVAGVVVNVRPNVSRESFDRLKAILTNCIRLGPSTQNRDEVGDFAAHLRGRIAHVTQLNPSRGSKLLALFQRIDWRR